MKIANYHDNYFQLRTIDLGWRLNKNHFLASSNETQDNVSDHRTTQKFTEYSSQIYTNLQFELQQHNKELSVLSMSNCTAEKKN